MWGQVHQALLESLHRAVFKVATLLPGVLALIVALVVSIFIGWLLAAILRRILLALHFDTPSGTIRSRQYFRLVVRQNAHLPGYPHRLLADRRRWAVCRRRRF